jgi:hypothetical protein
MVRLVSDKLLLQLWMQELANGMSDKVVFASFESFVVE